MHVLYGNLTHVVAMFSYVLYGIAIDSGHKPELLWLPLSGMTLTFSVWPGASDTAEHTSYCMRLVHFLLFHR